MIEEGDLKERIKKAQEEDERVVKVVEELKKAGIKILKDEEWKIKNGIVMKDICARRGTQGKNNTIAP